MISLQQEEQGVLQRIMIPKEPWAPHHEVSLEINEEADNTKTD